jgi:hypothetical protein
LVQVPTLLGTLHAWHEPPHVESQHTPSTQKPLAQLLATWHGWPSVCIVGMRSGTGPKSPLTSPALMSVVDGSSPFFQQASSLAQ